MEVAEQILSIAAHGESSLQLWAHYLVGFTFHALAEYSLARDHLERSVALYDRTRSGSYGFV